VISLAYLPLALWLIALVDILRNEFTGNNKIVWLLTVVFVPLIGAIVYFFIGRKQRLARAGRV
jgi:hypothetical protein